jgi:FtsH-binding integral membrane protein
MDTSIATLNRSTFEERQKNVSYMRSLYFLLAAQLLVAVGWVLIVINSDSMADWIRTYWGIALAAAIICLILILVVYFVPSLSNGGAASVAIYFIFTILFAYVWGYLCARYLDTNYAFYILLLLTAIAIGFAVYTFGSSTYLQSLASFIIVLVASAIVFLLFLIFTKIKFFWLLLILIPVMIFGFYLNYDIRRMVVFISCR